MKLKNIIDNVRDNARDFSGTIFNTGTIRRYVNESIDRIMQVVPEYQYLAYLESGEDEIEFIPRKYIQLLTLYATARCFTQDGDLAQGVTYMNEFEIKLEEFRHALDCGDVVLRDCEGCVIEHQRNEYVNLNYGKRCTPSRNVPYFSDEEEY